MKTTIQIRDEKMELESCLETFQIYENTFKSNLLNGIDKIADNRSKKDIDNVLTVNTLFDMCHVIWALVATADSTKKLDDFKRLDPTEIITAYSVASNLVVKSFQVSPKNVSAVETEVVNAQI